MWPSVKLGYIFEIARGGSPRPIIDYISEAPDAVNWISIKDASESSKYIWKTKLKIRPDGVAKSRLVKPGDFLLTNSMSFGRPYILKTMGCIHDGWLVLSDRTRAVDQDFFFHLLGSPHVYREFSRRAAGAVVKNLNIDLVKNVEVPLPPLPEQRRIAAILDKADTLRRQRREAMRLSEEFLRSAFLEMFGDPVTNPKGWEVVPLGQAGKWLSGGTPNRKSPEYWNGDIPWISAKSLKTSILEASSENLTEAGSRNGSRVVPEDAILFVVRGMSLAKEFRVGMTTRPVAFNQDVKAILPRQDIEPSYLLLHLKYAQAGLLNLVDTASHGTKKLNTDELSAWLVPLAPRELQRRAKTLLDKKRACERALSEGEVQHHALFNSLVQRAFRGEL